MMIDSCNMWIWPLLVVYVATLGIVFGYRLRLYQENKKGMKGPPMPRPKPPPMSHREWLDRDKSDISLSRPPLPPRDTDMEK